MKEIIFNNWKQEALRGRDKTVGKIISSYWRLHYDKNKDTVTFWQRTYDKSNDSRVMNEEKRRVFTINNQSQLTMNIANTRFDQSLKNIINKQIHLHLKKIPTIQREKYTLPDIHEFQHNKKRFIYIPNETVFDTYGNIIQLGSYQVEKIDKEFNKEITKLSRIFREKLNIIGNLMHLNLPKSQILKKYKRPGNRLNFDVCEKDIYADLHTKIIMPELFIKWQKWSYLFDNSYYYSSSIDKPNEPLLDVRKQAKKVINKARKTIAQTENKITYTMVKQDVNGSGL